MVSLAKSIIKTIVVSTVTDSLNAKDSKGTSGIKNVLKGTNKLLNSSLNIVDSAAFGIIRLASGILHGIVDIATFQVLHDDKDVQQNDTSNDQYKN